MKMSKWGYHWMGIYTIPPLLGYLYYTPVNEEELRKTLQKKDPISTQQGKIHLATFKTLLLNQNSDENQAKFETCIRPGPPTPRH